MVFGGGKKQKEAEATAERARKEVLFWKDQLDHAVNEKNSLLDRYTELYRHSFQLEHAVVTLNTENTELRHVLDRTVGLPDERRTLGGPATPTSGSGASTPDGRQLQHTLTNTRVALKQADVRIAIMEERNITLQQENDLLHKQNELLRSSEAAYQKEAQLLREELSNARGINDLTADETTKLLLDNSRLQQALVAARSEVLHKDEMLRLLSAEINELNAKIEMYAGACQSIGLDVSWDGLLAEPSSDKLDTTATAAWQSGASHGGSAGAAAHLASAIAEEVQPETAQSCSANGTAAFKKSSAGGRSVGGGSSSGAEPSSTEAAVEALAAALPLRMSGMGSMLRSSTQDRKGTFSGQPITPRDMAEAKQKLAEQEGRQQHQGSSSSGGGGGHLSARAARPTPRSSWGAKAGAQLPPIPPVPAGGITSLVHSPRSNRGTSHTAAGPAGEQQQRRGSSSSCSSRSSGLHVVADEGSVDEDDDPEGMLQGSPNLAEVAQRSLVREASPMLTLNTTNTPVPSGTGGANALSACEAAAVAAVTAAVRSSLNSLSATNPELHTAADADNAAPTPAIVDNVATAVAATAAARAVLAAGAAASSAQDTVNEFKLAANVVPPADAADADDEAAAEPVELTELQPGIPQRQQALARLAAGQNQPSRPSAGRRLAVAHAEGHNSAAPSPRSNLAEAMLNPAALVAAAAAAGVLDAPDSVPINVEPAAAVAAAEGAAAVVVCQRQAALARLAAERESRLQQQQQGGSGGARSRSSSPADAATQRRTAAVTRLGNADGGSSSSERQKDSDAADAEATVQDAAAAAVEHAIDSQPAVTAAAAECAAVESSTGAVAGEDTSRSEAVTDTPKNDEIQDSIGGSFETVPAAAKAAGTGSSDIKGTSSQGNKMDCSGAVADTAQQQQPEAAAKTAAQAIEVEPAATIAAGVVKADKPVSSDALSATAAEADSKPEAIAVEPEADLKVSTAGDTPAPAAANITSVGAPAPTAVIEPPAPAAAMPFAAADGNAAAADGNAAAAAGGLAPVATKPKETAPARSNSLKDRIAAMNALNQSGSPSGSPKAAEGRSSSGGGSRSGSSGGGGLVSRFLQADQQKQQQGRAGSRSSNSSSGGGGTAPSRIPHGPSQKSKIPAAISNIPSKIPTAPEASDAAGGRSRNASSVEQQPQQDDVPAVNVVPDAPPAAGKVTAHSAAAPAVAADQAKPVGSQTSGPASASSDHWVNGHAPTADSGKHFGKGEAPTVAATRSSSGGVDDVVVEVRTPAAVAPKAAAAKVAGTSSKGGAADEDDVNAKDDINAAAAEAVKAAAPKRQLSNRMAAMRAAFEAK